jgi:hypothetical protein
MAAASIRPMPATGMSRCWAYGVFTSTASGGSSDPEIR